MKSRTPLNSVEKSAKFCVGKMCHRYNERLSFDLNQGVQDARSDHNSSVKWEVTSKEPIPAKSNHSLLLQRGGLRFGFARHTFDSFSLPSGRTGEGKTVENRVLSSLWDR